MNDPAQMLAALQQHAELYRELLGWVEREAQTLNSPETHVPTPFAQARQRLLPQLSASVAELREIRQSWLRQPLADRARHPALPALLRQNQEMILKILVLDRENEQGLLRRGLLPANRLPAAQRQRPHFVAELYRRSAAT
jgi:hypothetical protein